MYVMLGVGALMTIVGFLGCCGAWRESPWMLGTVRVDTNHFVYPNNLNVRLGWRWRCWIAELVLVGPAPFFNSLDLNIAEIFNRLVMFERLKLCPACKVRYWSGPVRYWLESLDLLNFRQTSIFLVCSVPVPYQRQNNLSNPSKKYCEFN